LSQANKNRFNGAAAVPVGEGRQGFVHTSVACVDRAKINLGHKSHHRRDSGVVRTAGDAKFVQATVVDGLEQNEVNF